MTNQDALIFGFLGLGGLFFLSQLDIRLPPPPSVASQTWVITEPTASVKSEWTFSEDNTASEIKTEPKTAKRSTQSVPQDVRELVNELAYSCGIEPEILLAIAKHERAGVHGWHDDYIMGYGAFDDGRAWGSKFKGWRNQLNYASRKVCRHFVTTTPSVVAFQTFARDVYKTTDWSHYRNAYQYYLGFKQ